MANAGVFLPLISTVYRTNQNLACSELAKVTRFVKLAQGGGEGGRGMENREWGIGQGGGRMENGYMEWIMGKGIMRKGKGEWENEEWGRGKNEEWEYGMWKGEWERGMENGEWAGDWKMKNGKWRRRMQN